jgi:hypothetical protein
VLRESARAMPDPYLIVPVPGSVFEIWRYPPSPVRTGRSKA